MSTAAVIELQEVQSRDEPAPSPLNTFTLEEDVVQPDAQSLPPYDGGKVAWRLLWTMFVFEALLWGTFLSSS